ncbi:MAG TPA: hypothetical protein VFK44_05595, partial [Bacillales bacterium]|nr:hypothetical protein [Bacillales bacterium]
KIDHEERYFLRMVKKEARNRLDLKNNAPHARFYWKMGFLKEIRCLVSVNFKNKMRLTKKGRVSLPTSLSNEREKAE